MKRILQNQQQFEARCKDWLALPVIALDTEFERRSTFYAKLGLLQVFDGKEVEFFDPLVLEDISPFAEVLESSNVIKLIHSGVEDVELLHQLTDVKPQSIGDTQIAVSMTGSGLSLGYQALVQNMLGVELPKGAQRSDWMKRPLSQQQLDYAADDVDYLFQIYPMLLAQLEQLGRVDWWQEDCKRMVESACSVADPETYYLRFKQLHKVSGDDLLLLKRLAAWRERRAVTSNRPRNWILNNKQILDIVFAKPNSTAALERLDLPAKFVSRNSQRLISLVNDPVTEEETESMARPLPNFRGDAAGQLFKALQDVIAAQAESLALEPGVLASRKRLQEFVYWRLDLSEKPEWLDGWRGEVLGTDLNQAFEPFGDRNLF